MILTHTPNTLIGTGAFGDILRLDDGTVVKLFRRMEVTHDPIETPVDHEVVIRAVWDAEASAFELAAKTPGLGEYLVPFHGRCRITDVIDGTGQSIATRYVLDCGIRLAFVPGRAEKVAHMQKHPLFPEIDKYLDRLADSGIKSPYDGSVFVPGLNKPFTVIDVATWEAMAELTGALAMTGRLPDHIRARWGPPATA